MRSKLILCLLASAIHLINCGKPEPKVYPNRWFYLVRSLETDQQVAEVCSLVQVARNSGLNGVVLDDGLDKLDLQPPEYFTRLHRVRDFCAQQKVDIIPCIFSVGYGHSLLAHNRHLAAGVPVTNVLHVVRNGKGVFVPYPTVVLVNRGFEQFEKHKFGGWWLQDRPGRVSFVDTVTVHQGTAAVRFQNFHKSYKGHGRVMQEVEVQPHRTYRITGWVKTEDLEPARCFKILVLRRDRSELTPRRYNVPGTTDWQKVEVEFNSFGQHKVRVYAGVWGARKGRLWLDDFTLKEVGVLNILRRPGTPVTVKSQTTGQEYKEGRDYAPITDTIMDFKYGRDPLPVTILPESRIGEGDSLAVSYYHPIPVRYHQISMCMSEPEVYTIWKTQARLIHQHLAPKYYFLDMDEIRSGGECRACKEGDKTMGEILGSCITRQYNLIKAVNPNAEIYIWSDMLDPEHNAIKGYYLIRRDLSRSWEHIPPDLGILCWHYNLRKKSLRHFSRLGFKTMAAAFYDNSSLDVTRDWLTELDRTAGAAGVLYTTWQGKYRMLREFGEAVSNRKAKTNND